MEKELSFNGCFPSKIKKFSQIFDEMECEDGHLIAISKETFHYNDKGDGGDLEFDYKLCLEQVDYSGAFWVEECGMKKEDSMGTSLYLIPSFSSLCEEKKKSVMLSAEGESEGDITYENVYSYGLSIPFGFEKHPREEGEEKRDAISSSMEAFSDILFGFLMDAPKNAIGTSGWDYIREFCLGEKRRY